MDHAVNIRVRVKDLVEGCLVSNIEIDELRTLSTNQFYAIECLL